MAQSSIESANDSTGPLTDDGGRKGVNAMYVGWLWMLLPVLLIVVVAVVAVQAGARGDGGDAARQALARRFAEGEIDEREYRERSATIDDLRPAGVGVGWWPWAVAAGAAVLLLVTFLASGGMDPGWMPGHMWR